MTVMRAITLAALACVLGCGSHAAAPAASPKPEEASAPVAIGDLAPAFALDSVNGAGRASLEAFRGDVVVVAFWATWSEPDKRLLIRLEDIRRGHARARLRIVGVSIDDEKEQLPEFASTYHLGFPIVWEADRATTSRWKPQTDPATFILDRTGVVRFVHRGFHDGEDKDIEREIDELLR